MSNRNTPVPAKSRSFDSADALVFRSEWRVDGDLVTPTSNTITFLRPDGTTAQKIAVEDGTGYLTTTYVPTSYGRYWFKWDGLGAAVSFKEGTFYITRNLNDIPVYPEYS